MRPHDRRKAIRNLKRLCRDHGIILTVETSRGDGSHQGLIFADAKTGEAITLVISGDNEISAGVQRSILHYVKDLSQNENAASIARNLAEIVRVLLEQIFK